MLKSLAKTTMVVVSSTILVTLTTNAFDMRGDFYNTMLGSLFSAFTSGVGNESAPCPENMVLVTQAIEPFCIDRYEASPAKKTCTYSTPKDEIDTMINLSNESCGAVSIPNTMPWTHITQEQAQFACERSGKRLPTASEWYKGALGTPDEVGGITEEHCNIANNRADGIAKTGTGIRCVSDVGAYDMVGNVWEWVKETVHKGQWDGRMLPQGGFVTHVDVHGIATETKSSQDALFNGDRFWLDATITTGMMRGGYHNTKSQAGIFATYVASPPHFTGDATGFRCVVTVKE